jgi:Tfp pilus assembly protein PilO
MKESTKIALAVVAVVGIAAAFWLVLLGPKRDQAGELGRQVSTVRSEVSTEQQRAADSVAAKKSYPSDYTQLVGLGQAVPAEAATPSLLVQLEGLSTKSKTDFIGITSGSEGAEGEVAITAEGTAGLAPLGATAGPAGLLKMPYQLQFEGGFFGIANFIHGVDSLVKTKQGKVEAKGRLMTIDNFTLTSGGGEGSEAPPSSQLSADFSITTYVTPPGQGLTSSKAPDEETIAEIP